MLHQERKKEKELEKRERLNSNNSPSRPKRTVSKTNSERYFTTTRLFFFAVFKPRLYTKYHKKTTQKSDDKLNSLENSFTKLIQKQSTASAQPKTFQPFEIEFLEPSLYNVNCIRLMSFHEEHALTVYRGVDVNSNEIYGVYEWRYVLEKNKIFEKKKLDICQAEVDSIKSKNKNLKKKLK